ncbi:putative ABC transport system ATP-binding protein [Lachnospiraceae bacterium PM6-15]|uniref:ABC transporter ATP-binding protein n=1 Tax=Ohessyouella blattaphilus TaxID=2949333 RepID=A0ABT1EJ75_9FIRM|nr:ABC transporter ATP-binding protein [Ohessyouella blattaphilus]MCP1110754.1 ABC transporter ATP-binding protein [Ohessyouella blattaphilus]MCR8564148.1 ABC transporter ATP-binding protein [Ohessyouella blattaphilus]
MSILELKSVSYSYPGTKKQVLLDVNIGFETGKLYSIMGKSGAGKSTMLSLISGLDICTDGTILCDGESLSEMNRDDYRAKKIGVIFQGYNLLTNATAIENMELSMKISGCKSGNIKKEAYGLLEKVGIDKETAKRKVLKLSGGEQQRVGIARAIAHHPDIVIADEPTGNLDSDTQDTIMSILTDLAHKENKCVIVVTHSKKVATYADELWGLNGGKLSFLK